MSRGTQCCAGGCKKRRKRKSDGRSDSDGSADEESELKKKFYRTFHSLPSDPERKKQWLIEMHRPDWTPSIHSRICSDHFLEKHINRTGQRIELRENATPTRFKKYPRTKEIEEQEPPTVRSDLNQLAEIVAGMCRSEQQSACNFNSVTTLRTDEAVEQPMSESVEECQIESSSNAYSLSNRTDIVEEHQFQASSNAYLLNNGTIKPCLNQIVGRRQFGPSAVNIDALSNMQMIIDKQTQRIIHLKKKLKTEQQKTRRLEKRMKSMKAFIKQVKENNHSNSRKCEKVKNHILNKQNVLPVGVSLQLPNRVNSTSRKKLKKLKKPIVSASSISFQPGSQVISRNSQKLNKQSTSFTGFVLQLPQKVTGDISQNIHKVNSQNVAPSDLTLLLPHQVTGGDNSTSCGELNKQTVSTTGVSSQLGKQVMDDGISTNCDELNKQNTATSDVVLESLNQLTDIILINCEEFQKQNVSTSLKLPKQGVYISRNSQQVNIPASSIPLQSLNVGKDTSGKSRVVNKQNLSASGITLQLVNDVTGISRSCQDIKKQISVSLQASPKPLMTSGNERQDIE